MSKAIIVYGTTMGNTEIMAEAVEKTLGRKGVDITTKNVAGVTPEELLNYDLVLFGCSTWGDGELQDDFIHFYDQMKSLDLSGKKSACFGPGDSGYSLFCKAVDDLEDQLRSCGAEIISESLKIDGDVDSQIPLVQDWAGKIAEIDW